MKISRIAYPLALASSALAATETATATSSITSIFLPGFDQQSLVASVITAAPSATTYFVQCDPENQLNCEVGNGMTLTEGPSTFEINVNSTEMTISEACLVSSDTASCTYSVAGSGSGSEAASGLQAMYLNVTITAGFDALASASSAAAAQAAAKTAEAVPTSSITSMGTSTASSVGATESASGLGSTGVQMARWDIGRVGMIFGVVASLLISW